MAAPRMTRLSRRSHLPRSPSVFLGRAAKIPRSLLCLCATKRIQGDPFVDLTRGPQQLKTNSTMAQPVTVEPVTSGQATIKTTAGDILLEFWPREAPKAVRK